MDNLKFSVLDVFGYVFLGLFCLLALVVLFDRSITYIIDISSLSASIDFGKGLLILIMAFVLGFAIDSPGTKLFESYNYVLNKIWGLPIPNEVSSSNRPNVELRALAREYAPQNFYWLQQWKVLKTMSHNFAFSGLVFLLGAYLKSYRYPTQIFWNEWTFFAIGLIFIIFLFLSRARVFDTWHYRELEVAVRVLKLDQKIRAKVA